MMFFSDPIKLWFRRRSVDSSMTEPGTTQAILPNFASKERRNTLAALPSKKRLSSSTPPSPTFQQRSQNKDDPEYGVFKSKKKDSKGRKFLSRSASRSHDRSRDRSASPPRQVSSLYQLVLSSSELPANTTNNLAQRMFLHGDSPHRLRHFPSAACAKDCRPIPQLKHGRSMSKPENIFPSGDTRGWSCRSRRASDNHLYWPRRLSANLEMPLSPIPCCEPLEQNSDPECCTEQESPSFQVRQAVIHERRHSEHRAPIMHERRRSEPQQHMVPERRRSETLEHISRARRRSEAHEHILHERRRSEALEHRRRSETLEHILHESHERRRSETQERILQEKQRSETRGRKVTRSQSQHVKGNVTKAVLSLRSRSSSRSPARWPRDPVMFDDRGKFYMYLIFV